MDYTLIEPITKPNGEKIETVSVKEKFTGRDVKVIGNAGGEGSATIALVFVRWRSLGLDDGFAVLAGVFHWPYDQIMSLDEDAFKYSVNAAMKFLKWKTPKTKK